ncbi:dihydroxyacetone kinase subunit DhaK [Kineococcus gynurae]|uniref:Dihydroxyacetone kinase subunit DhaK n=1 Tax=Kineococcus gynurae TaxID=452979 RepID=A0ABV5LSS7_9ACTN
MTVGTTTDAGAAPPGGAAAPDRASGAARTTTGRRQFLNDRDELVREAVEGFCLARPDLVELRTDPLFVVRAPAHRRADKVALVSGGGSGHEPLHTGMVGPGMLDAAVPGAVFTSPTALQVAAATRFVDAGAGALHVVKNYTGDVLNFRIAAEIAADDGARVGSVLVDDDLATDPAVTGLDDGPGRRGTAAVVVVEKVCGAAAEQGAPLDELVRLGRRVSARSRTLAVALTGPTHPGERLPSFDLPEDTVEFGVGIHGERGVDRRPFGPARELVGMIMDHLVDAVEVARGDEVLVVVNGLGSTHPLELSVAYREVVRVLAARGVEVVRRLVGSPVTSLDMAGLSVTLVPVDEELVRHWDAPVRTAALTW